MERIVKQDAEQVMGRAPGAVSAPEHSLMP